MKLLIWYQGNNVSNSLFHKVRKGGQKPAFHRPALLPLQIIYSHTTPKQTQSKAKHSDTLSTQHMWVNCNRLSGNRSPHTRGESTPNAP